jgi:hypothetical protein
MANRKWAVNYALNMEPTSVVVRKREIEMKQRDGIGKIVRRRPGGRSQGLGAHKQLHRPTIRKLQVSQYTHVCAARSAGCTAECSSIRFQETHSLARSTNEPLKMPPSNHASEY